MCKNIIDSHHLRDVNSIDIKMGNVIDEIHLQTPLKKISSYKQADARTRRPFHPAKIQQVNSWCRPVTLPRCKQSRSYIAGTRSFRLSIRLASVFNNISPNFTRSFARFESTHLATLWSSSTRRRRVSANPTPIDIEPCSPPSIEPMYVTGFFPLSLFRIASIFDFFFFFFYVTFSERVILHRVLTWEEWSIAEKILEQFVTIAWINGIDKNFWVPELSQHWTMKCWKIKNFVWYLPIDIQLAIFIIICC